MRIFTALTTLTALLATSAFAVAPIGRTTDNSHQVPAGGRMTHVGGTIYVLDAYGDVVTHTETDRAAFSSREESGYIAFAFWDDPDPTPVSSFSTTFIVPPAPATFDGQTVFLWNGRGQLSGVSAIIQAVLQVCSPPLCFYFS